MSNLRAVQPALDAYHTGYRNPKLRPLHSSGLYALFPDTSIPPAGVKFAGKWPELWPDVDNPGVYVFLDANFDVTYVGKTFLKQSFGTRFYDWFKREKNTGACSVVGVWKSPPAYVITVPVQEPFEAPSLEEYLIQELDPSDNLVGRKPEQHCFNEGDIVAVEWPEPRYGVALKGIWEGRVIAKEGRDRITVHFEYQAYEDESGSIKKDDPEDIVIDVGRGVDEKYGETVIVILPQKSQVK